MKRHHLLILAGICAGVMLQSCGTMAPSGPGSATTSNTGSSTSATATSVLGSLLDGLIGNAVPVNEQNIQGTWVYSSPEARFESESLLAQAGGEVAAASIEQKLAEIYAKIGVTPGKTSFVFNSDKTCAIQLGAQTIRGTYSVDPKTNTLNIVATGGLIKLNGKVYFGLNSLIVLFDANKILTVAQTLCAVSGNNSSTLGALSGALSNYKGLMLGMNLGKGR